MKTPQFGMIALLLAGSILVMPATADAKGNKGKKGVRALLLEKYDTNNDGKLSKQEKSKMSAADLARLPAKKTKKVK